MNLCSFFFNPFCFSTLRQIELKGSLRNSLETNAGSSFSGLEDIDSFVVGTLENSILDLEFFQDSDELTVEVCDNHGNQLFLETLEIAEGLHVIADLSQSAHQHRVRVYSSLGVNLSGEFTLYRTPFKSITKSPALTLFP